MPCFGIFELQFWETIVVFKISILEFAKMQIFEQKWKSLNLGPKMSHVFGLKVLKNWGLQM